MARWLQIRCRWRPDLGFPPTRAEIRESALLQRLRRGYEPLPYPPPVRRLRPWYALVEEAKPHFISHLASHEIAGQHGPWEAATIRFERARGITPGLVRLGDEVVRILGWYYRVEEKMNAETYVVRDAVYDTPYRFRLWLEDETMLGRQATGRHASGWFMQTGALENRIAPDLIEAEAIHPI